MSLRPDLYKIHHHIPDHLKIEKAISNYTEAQQFNPSIVISAPYWNALCWYGSLHGHAADVINYCEKAVELQPESRDRRGLARALTGDIEGAIDDFQAFVDSFEKVQEFIDLIDKTEPQTDEQKLQFQKLKRLKKLKRQRQGWIDALRAGENPFTEEVLKSLLSE